MGSEELRKELELKRYEIAVMEADVKIMDLEAEIEKVKERKKITQNKLEKLKKGEEE